MTPDACLPRTMHANPHSLPPTPPRAWVGGPRARGRRPACLFQRLPGLATLARPLLPVLSSPLFLVFLQAPRPPLFVIVPCHTARRDQPLACVVGRVKLPPARLPCMHATRHHMPLHGLLL